MDFIFEQNQTVDTLDKVPADFRPFYTEGDDKKFNLAEPFKNVTKAIDGLNKTTKNLRGEEKKLKDLVSAWSGLGETPEAVKAIMDDLNEKITSGSKVNPEKIKEEITKAFQGQLAEKDKKIDGMTGTLRKYLVDSEATTAIAAVKGVPELLLPHIRSQVKVVEKDGEYKTVVVDASGDTRYGPTGSEMTIGELVNSMKADKIFGRAFESENAGGGGSNPGGSQKKVTTPNKDVVKSSLDKISAGLAKRAGG